MFWRKRDQSHNCCRPMQVEVKPPVAEQNEVLMSGLEYKCSLMIRCMSNAERRREGIILDVAVVVEDVDGD